MSLLYEREENLQEQTPEEYLLQYKKQLKNRALWSIGVGLSIVIFNIVLMWIIVNLPDLDLGISRKDFFSLLFRNVFFLIGLFFLVAGLWWLYESRKITLEDITLSPEAAAFIEKASEIRPTYSYIILACLVTVFFFQLMTLIDRNGDFRAFTIAGLVKPDTWEKNEYWRILTSAFLHGGFLHIYFNAQAFYGFASLIEAVSNRARMALVFLFSIIGGGLMSMIFLPEGISVGASGGIMGLIGYLAVYGYRRKRQLPPNFLRSMLINIGFVAAFGIVAYRIIDNFAHLGGLLVGLIYGLLTVPRRISEDPRAVTPLTEAAGMIAMGVLVFFAILTILLMTEYVVF
ncbi:MAG: rhomboid family intramembrane serine protease [Acidobacteria bacterium]|jgi:membrane associated rhomboid family serine protease|nr:MAG: rhomboid family intramembrane serine protease [Acidobacteriota bacterium]GIU82065.1 MAG: hypothetical protein KatS3mg006_1129 [Pyrinomonadaceae bacterium]